MGGEQENFHARRTTYERCLGPHPADRYLPHPWPLHRTRAKASEITSAIILPLSSPSKNLSATLFLGCQQPCSCGTTPPHPLEERFLVCSASTAGPLVCQFLATLPVHLRH